MRNKFRKFFDLQDQEAFFGGPRGRGRGRGGQPPADDEDDEAEGRARSHHHHHHAHHHGRGGHPFGPRGFFGGGEGFGGPLGFFRRGPRAKRGDVRAGILALLKEAPLNGYQIMQQLGERSGGMWRPSPGSVYPALQQLQDENLVLAEAEGSGKRFSLTDDGRKYCDEHAAEVDAPWEKMAGDDEDGRMELFSQMRTIGIALAQVAQTGSPAQIQQVKKILGDARRAIYKMLAEDETP